MVYKVLLKISNNIRHLDMNVNNEITRKPQMFVKIYNCCRIQIRIYIRCLSRIWHRLYTFYYYLCE